MTNSKQNRPVMSMTGFGESRFASETAEYRIQLSSVNHRFLEISMRTPEELAFLEAGIKSYLKSRISRGRVVFMIEKKGGPADYNIRIDADASGKYVDGLKNLSKRFGLNPGIRTIELLSLPGVISSDKSSPDPESMRMLVGKGVEEAVSSFIRMRTKEGENLKKDIQKAISSIEKHAAAIEKRAGIASRKKEAVIKKKLKEAGVRLSEGSFASEVVNLVNRMDINEELVRLSSHLQQFNASISKKPSGAKLEFILQEMLREANTIASKSQDIAITDRIIEIKTELQKLREQVQNIE